MLHEWVFALHASALLASGWLISSLKSFFPPKILFCLWPSPINGRRSTYLEIKMCLSLVAILWPKTEGSSFLTELNSENFNRWQHFNDMIFGEMGLSVVVIPGE